MEEVFGRASALYRKGDLEGALAVLGNQTDLFLKLAECKLLEESGDADRTETAYMELLAQTPSCPLGVLHYLAFVSKSRGVDEALGFFDDLCLAESDHVTWELYPAVAMAIAWNHPGSASFVRLEKCMDIFRRGLLRVKGAKRAELVSVFADFLALNATQLKLAELETSKFLSDNSNSQHAPAVWAKWEEILLEFNADFRTVRALGALESNLLADDSDDSLLESAGGLMVLSDHPGGAAVDSWLLKQAPFTLLQAESVMAKFSTGVEPGLKPNSSIIELVLGLPRIGQLTLDAVDLRDGGDEPTNHVFRPDVTRMVKYDPTNFVELKELARPLANLIKLLPEKPLKHANAQYIADQCIRLLVSVAMPSRMMAEETYANVDKRTRAAIESRIVKVKPVPVVAPKEKPEEPKVKKEEVFDPVEFYNRQT